MTDTHPEPLRDWLWGVLLIAVLNVVVLAVAVTAAFKFGQAQPAQAPTVRYYGVSSVEARDAAVIVKFKPVKAAK